MINMITNQYHLSVCPFRIANFQYGFIVPNNTLKMTVPVFGRDINFFALKKSITQPSIRLSAQQINKVLSKLQIHSLLHAICGYLFFIFPDIYS